jgi:hypothetical protein
MDADDEMTDEQLRARLYEQCNDHGEKMSREDLLECIRSWDRYFEQLRKAMSK